MTTMARKGKALTVHDNASAPVTSEQQDELRALRDTRQLPAGNSMTAMLDLVLDGDGIVYTYRKLTEWLNTLPEIGAVTEDDFSTWSPERVTEVFEAVAMLGMSYRDAAELHGTTPAIVKAIYDKCRAGNRRGRR